MKHKTNQALFDYWTAVRAGRPAPRRSEIEPGDIRRLLPHIFILEKKNRNDYRFRLAGTSLCSTYGMEFRGHNMLSLWTDDCEERLRQALEDTLANATISVVEYTASTTDGREATFEMVLLPLAHEDGSLTRILGAALPVDHLPWLGEQLFTRQWIDRLRRLDPDQMPRRKTAMLEPAARRIIMDKPSASIGGLSNQMLQKPLLRSERSYLRLIKSGTSAEQNRKNA